MNVQVRTRFDDGLDLDQIRAQVTVRPQPIIELSGIEPRNAGASQDSFYYLNSSEANIRVQSARAPRRRGLATRRSPYSVVLVETVESTFSTP